MGAVAAGSHAATLEAACVPAAPPSVSPLSLRPRCCLWRWQEETAKVAARRSEDHVATLPSRHLSQSSLVTDTPVAGTLGALLSLSLSFLPLSLSFRLSKINPVSSSRLLVLQHTAPFSTTRLQTVLNCFLSLTELYKLEMISSLITKTCFFLVCVRCTETISFSRRVVSHCS